LNIDFGIEDERQDCKIGAVGGLRVLVGGWKVNEGDEGEGIWLMGFMYIHEMSEETTCNCLSWVGRVLGEDSEGNLINVQCKAIGNLHNESSL
jgi:hypothetical protein